MSGLRNWGGVRLGAQQAIPGLIWIADGRNPWKLFVDERFIGNSKRDPCSAKLKRMLMDKWQKDNIVNWKTTLIFGLDWMERGRIDGDRKKKLGIRKLKASKGWRSTFPMDEKPYLTHEELKDWVKQEGMRIPRMYDLDFPHNNCGGFCVRAGFAQFNHLLNVLPERFAWHEAQEQAAREAIRTVETVLKYRPTKKRKARSVSLKEFRETIQKEPRLFDSHGWGCGGGCAVDDDENDSVVESEVTS
jgi:hypothetical protein